MLKKISMRKKFMYCILNLLVLSSNVGCINNNRFPDNFLFGVATSSFQVEGGWDADGKGENVWDHFTHTTSYVITGENADVSSDEYHKWEEDVQLLKDLGVNHYRFSLSWSRILPSGFTNKINPAGVSYYKNFIKALKANNIEPVVTLHHWDFPQPLQDLGGWTNPNMADYFASYARVAFREFGDDVKVWTTFNEPKNSCNLGYGTGQLAPGISAPGIGEYLCSYTVLLAHAKAYHIYDEEFRSTQDGLISIDIDSPWAEPVTDIAENVEAAERLLQFNLGIFGHPIFNGNWPQVVIDRIQLRSAGENFTESRLPLFTEEQIEFIKGTYDYLGLNSYSTTLVRNVPEAEFGDPSFDKDVKVQQFSDPSWNISSTGIIMIVPWGERKLLKWVKETYNNPKIFILENGVADDGTSLDDDERINYLREYLSSVLDAIYEDEVNIIGYTVWSFVDNFEWGLGYSQHYGFYHVDFTSENRTRTPKKSVDFFKKLVATHCLSDECIDSTDDDL